MDSKLLSMYRTAGVGIRRFPLGARVQVKGKKYRSIEPGCVVTYGGGQVVVVHDRTGERRSWWPDELKESA